MGDVERGKELLTEAAAALNDQRDPFSLDWLAENNVTADECFDLSQNIATLLYGYLGAPADVKQQIMLIGACTASGMPPEIIEGARNHLRLGQLTKELKARVGARKRS